MRQQSGGFALIESLVAVLVLLLGIVGAMGMQARGITAVSDASGRAEVSIAAEELIGMMWNDQANLDNYAWNGSGAPPSSYADWYDDLTTKHMPGIQVAVNVTPFGPTGQGRQIDINFTWQRPGTNAQRHYGVTTFVSPP